jgi:hypothetical protein
MADFQRYEFQGRTECSKCRATRVAEWRIQDADGVRIGKRVVRYACRCPAYAGQEGAVLSDDDMLDREIAEQGGTS